MRKAVVALALLLALPAAAQSPVMVAKESPRFGSFQFSLGPFSPDIDSEFINATAPLPYVATFGTGRPLMIQAMFSKSAWISEVGTLDIGFGVGYWQASGQGQAISGGTVVSGGSTSLLIIPLQLAVSYRVDWFFDRWEIPLAPYVRVALVDDIWVTSGQNGTSTWTNKVTGTTYRGQGGTFGWSATLGLALVLDAIDTALSRQMDYDIGINRTMLFFDFTRSSVNNFGSSTSWQLAPNYWAWSAGLLFVF